MGGIVLELQQEAINKDINVDMLIRKAYVVARKLKLKDFENWLKLELYGYKDGDVVPKYRMVRGLIFAEKANGYRTCAQLPSKEENQLSLIPIKHSIIDLNNQSKSAGNIRYHFTSAKNKELNQKGNFEAIFYVEIDKDKLYGVVNVVVNKILEWSLVLEENGIIGDNISFGNDEVEKAKNISVTNIINFSNCDSIDNVTIEQGKYNKDI
jgi:hypothetical protein